ncbi:MAG: hypothetical protein [Podoviridae sp. ctcf755]|nr:MAG: hypothetical protein [Podoviridae sp. ctcf755]
MSFKFLNVNPMGKREEDCVTRAISAAMDIDYYEVKHKLNLIADLFDCESLCVCCYKHLLDDVFNLDRIESYHGITIGEFLRRNPYGKFIIRTDGHLTFAKNGCIKDTWDCSDRIVDIVWQVK